MKNNRKRGSGWARTKKYPHERHPANYVRKKGDKIEYVTFTHSPEVSFDERNMPPRSIIAAVPHGRIRHSEDGVTYVTTFPMCDNISKKEREKNKRLGMPRHKYRSYAFPVVFEGERGALHSEVVGDFELVEEDKQHIALFFDNFPHVSVPVTGGAGQYKKSKKKKKPRK